MANGQSLSNEVNMLSTRTKCYTLILTSLYNSYFMISFDDDHNLYSYIFQHDQLTNANLLSEFSFVSNV